MKSVKFLSVILLFAFLSVAAISVGDTNDANDANDANETSAGGDASDAGSGDEPGLKEKLKKFTTHLEYMGYTIRIRQKYALGRHKDLLNITYRPFRGGVLFTATFGGSDFGKKNLDRFHKLCNDCNAMAVISRFYVDPESDLMIEAWYPGTYERKRFAYFLGEWKNDWTRCFNKHTAEVKKMVE